MALLQSLVLVASGSFWLHFPHTSARIEHFLAILAKCCESPWTSQALSHAAQAAFKEVRWCRRHPSLPVPFHLSCNSSVSSVSQVHLSPFKPSVKVENPRQVISLDRSDGEQARALFERVRKFRSHCEISDVIYKVSKTNTLQLSNFS
uniref:LRRC8 pannexin-like TM region domain-containing protein n=1 Tax=Labrus bergylta TaxID=56723 RepID=A0A3Q3F7H7_9LABR